MIDRKWIGHVLPASVLPRTGSADARGGATATMAASAAARWARAIWARACSRSRSSSRLSGLSCGQAARKRCSAGREVDSTSICMRSMPATRVKEGAAVSAKRPLPQ